MYRTTILQACAVGIVTAFATAPVLALPVTYFLPEICDPDPPSGIPSWVGAVLVWVPASIAGYFTGRRYLQDRTFRARRQLGQCL